MSDEKYEEIALFRYGLIAQVLNDQDVRQTKYFKKQSKKEHDVPYYGKKRYKANTFKDWLRRYRKGGFDALKPNTRSDKAKSRKIKESAERVIKERIAEFPFLSASALYRLLVAEGQIMKTDFNEGTLRKYIKDNKLRDHRGDPVARKKYEKEHVNELWIADGMHGPYILDGKKKKKVFLLSAIDDCSRVIVGARFFFHENSINLEIVLKEAITRFGLPKVFYCDNGSIFVSSHLQLACARLGIALVHSKPYDSPSRGKIERYHRTLRQKFLPLLNMVEIESIDDLNTRFCSWLDKEYQKGFHRGINGLPMDKLMDDLKHTAIKRVTKQELDLAFYMTIKRHVKNDSTVPINNKIYEVPHKFIGKKIEIRYPSDNPNDLNLYEDNKPVCKLKKLNAIENATIPSLGIKFNNKGE
jgi:transposase InsO family protein